MASTASRVADLGRPRGFEGGHVHVVLSAFGVNVMLSAFGVHVMSIPPVLFAFSCQSVPNVPGLRFRSPVCRPIPALPAFRTILAIRPAGNISPASDVFPLLADVGAGVPAVNASPYRPLCVARVPAIGTEPISHTVTATAILVAATTAVVRGLVVADRYA